jgi:SAM-dependent methyltransferase
VSVQPYDRVFAALYNKRWTSFAQGVAPAIRTYYESLPVSAQHRSLLDLACGTGQLMQHFAEHGYRGVGIDISPHMLHHARQNLASHIEAGQVALIEGDVAGFSLDEQFGLAVSTFDALNHLPDEDALLGCFRSTHGAGERAHSRIIGFLRGDGGMYERFSGTFFNTAFDMGRVSEMLAQAGFREAHAAQYTNFAAPVEDPEALGRAFFVARK